MNEKSVVVILAALCAVISGFTLITVRGRDHTAPEIIMEKKAIYYNGRDTSTLFDGVTAVDDRDGDVTDSLIISRIYPSGEGTGIVTYAAKDSTNNVTMATRGFFYEGYDPNDVTGINNMKSPDVMGDAQGTETVEGDTQTPEGTADGTPDGAAEGESDETAEGTVDYDRLREENLAAGIPFVKLVQYEAAIERGSDFNVFRYIEEAVDDADSISTMLRVDGAIDTTTAGEYELQIYAIDSDGNHSNIETLKITVE